MAKDNAFKPKKSSARMIRILLTTIFILKVVGTLLGTIITLATVSSLTKNVTTMADQTMGQLDQMVPQELMENVQMITGIAKALGSALVPVGILVALILVFKFYVDYRYKMMEVERTEDMRALRNLFVAKEAGVGNETAQLIEFIDGKADSITSRSSREKKAIFEEIRAVHTLLENQGGTPNSPYARR